jgi:hypothetical protein
MHTALLVFGFALGTVGAGALMVGVANNSFGIGNTLIIAGSVAVTGGLVLVGLSGLLRQLRLIGVALQARADLMGERMAEITALAQPPIASSGGEPEGVSSALDRTRRAADADPAPVRFDPGPPPRDRGRETARAVSPSVGPLPATLAHAPVAAESAHAAEAPLAREAGGSDVVPLHRHGRQRERRPFSTTEATPIRSGIVDGVGRYTLYSDGSIVAELPQGSRRFASIGELRAYLDEQG